MTFIDTNIFLRFLLHDANEQYKEAMRLFLDGAWGKVRLITSTIVFFEVYWVLRSYYGQEKTTLLETLQKLLAMQFIVLEERPLLLDALSFFEKRTFSLEDCYNFVYAKKQGVKLFKTFDIKLAKVFEKNL